MHHLKFNVFICEGFLVADEINYPIVTQAKTWNILIKRIDEVVRLFFELKESESYDLNLELSSEVIKKDNKKIKI